MEGRFVAYYRVSTGKQGRSGLGLEAQREAVCAFLNGGNWSLLAEHTEVESGKRDDRPELAKALHSCRLMGATLVIAKLDRLSRDAAFLLNLEKAGVEFVAADMPNANRLTLRLMAVIAQEERELISARTKAALAAAKARGVALGGRRATLRDGSANTHVIDNRLGTAALQARAEAFAATVGPVVAEMRSAGHSLRQIAAALTERGVRTARGGAWSADAVRSVLARMASMHGIEDGNAPNALTTTVAECQKRNATR
jgi:DNA invertase Pin-like site-specific DNA recombinase